MEREIQRERKSREAEITNTLKDGILNYKR
jgi:hypothetical protein